MPLQLKSSKALAPPRLLIYGQHGIGKTTLACAAPNPVALDFEDGLGALDVPSFGLLRSFEDVERSISQLLSEEHDRQTVVVDTADALEWLVQQRTCQRRGWRSVEDLGYGRGYIEALEDWRHVLDGLDMLRDRRGMAIVLTAHSEIRRFDSPEVEPYERYQPRLQARASALLQERVDAVLFAGHRVSTVRADVGFNRKVVRGVSSGDRVLYTTERPAAVAKNRYGMPDILPLSWEALAANLPFFTGKNGNG